MDTYSVLVENLTKKFVIEKNIGIRDFFSRKHHNKRYLKALDDVSFSIQKNEVFGILGLNGSGKTTLMKLIAGIYKPTSGSILVDGNIAPILTIGTGFNEELVPRDNIITYGILQGMSKKSIEKKVDSIIKFAELEDFKNTRTKHFSAGMKARLSLSTSLQIDTDILLIDEILAVGDASFQKKSLKALNEQKGKKTIIHTTHNVVIHKELSDRVLLLHKGKKVLLDQPKNVIEKYNQIYSNEGSDLQ